MNKREIFKTMGKSPRENVIGLAKKIEENHPVILVKKPSKTLIMLKMREPVAASEFFLGEMLACEAMVRIGEKRGMALTAGDDFDKVLAMSIVDAAYNAGVPEISWLEERLEEMRLDVEREERSEFGRNINSKVSFSIMEGS
jgi:alpha-D-ribose 1-methylphosphonate 5-triphosphate synthase subunit PhnG